MNDLTTAGDVPETGDHGTLCIWLIQALTVLVLGILMLTRPARTFVVLTSFSPSSAASPVS
jgi:hypothetical protein